MVLNVFLLPALYVWVAGSGDVLPPPEAGFEEQSPAPMNRLLA